jgi:hypothetical protein
VGADQGTSHRPVTGPICPLLAADRTSRAPCSGEAGTEKSSVCRLSGGRNSDRTAPCALRPASCALPPRSPTESQWPKPRPAEHAAATVAQPVAQPAAVDLPAAAARLHGCWTDSMVGEWKDSWVLWSGNQRSESLCCNNASVAIMHLLHQIRTHTAMPGPKWCGAPGAVSTAYENAFSAATLTMYAA